MTDNATQLRPHYVQAAIDDRRTSSTRPMGYLVCTDAFLSGWGEAAGRSLYALAYHTPEEAEALEIAARYRMEMKRPRLVTRLRADGTPQIKAGENDRITIVDRGQAAEWYRGAAARWAPEGGER